jgi:diguanylate cyclase (GGDEF)-like protein
MISFRIDDKLAISNLSPLAVQFFGLDSANSSRSKRKELASNAFFDSIVGIGSAKINSCDSSNINECKKLLLQCLKRDYFVFLVFKIKGRYKYLVANAQNISQVFTGTVDLVGRSFTTLSQANHWLNSVTSYFGQIVNSSLDAFAIVDCNGLIDFSNNVFHENFLNSFLLDSTPHSIYDFLFDADSVKIFKEHMKIVKKNVEQSTKFIEEECFESNFQVELKDKNGDKLVSLIRISPLNQLDLGLSNNYKFSVWIQDITKHILNQSQLDAVYMHDQLTGLPSRKLFTFQLNLDLIANHGGSDRTAVLFIDVDRFKGINDSLGHDAGDKVIQLVSTRIKNCLGPNQFLARFGGDEFILSVHGKNVLQKAVKIAAKVIDALTRPIEFDGTHVYISLSIGIATNQDADYDANTLISNSDTAMFEAKRRGGHRFEIFNEDLKERIVQSTAFETLLHSALEKEELKVYFQPLIQLPSLQTIGVEALIRWQHPSKGLIMPDSFIKTAEDTGLIVPIGEFVLKEACNTMDRWVTSESLIRPFSFENRTNSVVEVNLSAKQIDETNLIKTVESALRESNLAPEQLVLEITEGAQMEDPIKALKVFQELKRMGVKLAVDDFGTGFSSLTYLRSFPFDILKIDKSFVSVLSERPEEAIIVKTVIDLSHSLGLEVVAEGVETKEELDILIELGCDMAQGFLFSKPVEASELEGIGAF